MSKLQIDWLIHEPNRLGMMTMLAAQPCTFVEVRTRLSLTDGNLATHARLLEAAGYIAHQKDICTTYILTHDGREALVQYVATAQNINAMLMAALTTTVRFASQSLPTT